MIGVAANGNDNDSAVYSNWDYPNVFISAPGGFGFSFNDPVTEILSTVPFSFEDGSPALYQSIQGTSMASPFVAGLVALMKRERPLRTPPDIRRALAKTADKVLAPGGWDYGVPYGGYTPRGADPFHVCVVGECTWHPYWGYGQINVSTALLGAPPKVLSFTPSTGPVGTVVTISGEDLAAATEVSFGVAPTPAVTGTGRTSTILATPNENSIKVAVADGGITGQISVKTPGGVSASSGVFKVSPKITSFEPGTARRLVDTVTIHGENFTGATSVKIGLVAVTSFTVVDDETITFTLPPTAITGKLSVTTPSGIGTSVANLVVILPPTISGFLPASGAVGTVVTVSGTNLDSVTAGTLNVSTDVGVITHLTAASVRFTVPDPATTGKIALTNPAGTATSLADFKVSPKITSFDPISAKRGDTVTVFGKNFGVTGTTTVKVGLVFGTDVVVAPDGESLTFKVPLTGLTGRVSVTTPSGIGTSVANLVVILPPTISGFLPASGAVGTLVTVSGTSLDWVTAGTLNGVDLGAITHLTAASVRFTVLDGATTGKIALTNPAGTATSLADFKVSPKITSFEPASARRLVDTVTIHGKNFTGATAVRVGAVAAAGYSVDDDSTITFTVGATAVTGKISVTTPSGTATSVANLVVILPPTITGFTPASGPVGTLVTVSGTNLDSVISGTLNGTGVGTITHLTASSIRFAVPLGAAPTGNITVTNTAGTATSAGTFTIPFLITSFTPGNGPPGTVVTINGSGLSAVTLVEFNGSPAIPTSVTPTQVIAAVPPQATSGPIRVITATGSSATSVNSFSITPPATVQINEVSPDVFGGTDLVELKVLTSGTLQGIQLRQAPSSSPVVLATLSNTTVSAGDIVVVHLFPLPGVSTETAIKTECVNTACYAGAWDVTGNNFPITYSNEVLTISSEQGAVLDGIAFVRPSQGSTTTAGFRTDLGYLQSIGAWLPADCGGSPCTDLSTPSAMTVSADWDGVETPATDTAQRSGDADTDTDGDWTVGLPSLGATNP